MGVVAEPPSAANARAWAGRSPSPATSGASVRAPPFDPLELESMRPLLLGVLLACTQPVLSAQDLYDPTILRTVNLTFSQTNWFTLLQQNYQSQTEIPADLEMEGVTYPGVGVRIRGNTSYTTLPAGSQKVSLNIAMDFTDPTLDLLGYNSLNFNNAHRDPTFCREVAYSNFLSRYIPNGRANHIILTINGQNWGVYVNVQQYNRDMLRDYFEDEDGMRIKMPNNPNGPGLRYNGSLPSGYTQYELKYDGGLLDPWGAHIAVCNAVTSGLLASWQQTIDSVVAIDPSIWTIALENVFADDDSYVNKGADFVTYRDPYDGRTHVLQTDGNETFNATSWTIDRNFNSLNRPLMSHVLDVPELRQRYMAHIRAALAEFNWAHFEPIFTAHRNLIDAAVQADPKKLYSYTAFQSNFTASVNLGSGFGGGTVSGLQPFVNSRAAFIATHPEIAAPAPTIEWAQSSPPNPDPVDTVHVTARVVAPAVGLSTVTLFYLPAPGSYARVAMLDDGLSGDGAAGDGIYGAVLPVAARAGQRVKWYVGATSANAFQTATFEPFLSEVRPNVVSYRFGQSGMRITEYMYSGTNGEFIELTNTSAQNIDLTGWSLDDQTGVPGTVDLSAAGIVTPGQSILLVDIAPATFAANWGLTGVTILGPNTTAAIGRNDEINLFDDTGAVVDRLTYGDEDFPGSHRARDVAAAACHDALGANDVYRWSAAVVGDAWGSVASVGGNVGSPGSYVVVDCPALGTVYCTSNSNSTGMMAMLEVLGSRSLLANDVTLACSLLPLNSFGYFLTSVTQGNVAGPGGSQGTLCLGGAIGRYSSFVQNSGTTGEVSLGIDLSALSTPTGPVAALAGETWNFQYWYRDANPTVTSNLSDAVAVTWL
jgi:hypothetical protein